MIVCGLDEMENKQAPDAGICASEGVWLPCGIPNDQLGIEKDLTVCKIWISDFFHQNGTGLLADLEIGLGNGGDGRECHPGVFNVIKANDGELVRNPDA